MEKFLEMLGYRYIDTVTGYKGVASSLCFDLYGCVQIALSPPVDKEGKIPDGKWFDVVRLVRTGNEKNRVVKLPDYEHFARTNQLAFNKPGSGPAEKGPPKS